MEMYSNHIAELLVRLVTGVLFFFQGFDKVFRMKNDDIYKAVNSNFKGLKFPPTIVRMGVFVNSYIELIAGALLIVGLFKYVTLYALSLNLLVLAISFSVVNPVWNLKMYFPRFILIIALLLFPNSWELFSLDFLFNQK